MEQKHKFGCDALDKLSEPVALSNTCEQHTWFPCAKIPDDVVYAGTDKRTGDPVYVGRAMYNGNWLPAKVIPAHNYAAISEDGKEISLEKFDILRGTNYSWKSGYSKGEVPPGAVSTGITPTGPLYIGRALWAGTLTPGKVNANYGCLLLPHSHLEHRIVNNYDVLVQEGETSCVAKS